MRKIVFDIETRNTFHDVGKRDPALLDIALIAIYDSATDSYSTYLEEDLSKLWPILESADSIIGFNSEHFDLPLLNKYYSGDLGSIKHIDLMKEVQNVLGRRIGLDALAQATLGAKKGGHGLQSITWWRNGEIDKIREYCIQDVKLTKDLHDYILKNKCCKISDSATGKLTTIEIDVSKWEEKQENGLTFSLGF